MFRLEFLCHEECLREAFFIYSEEDLMLETADSSQRLLVKNSSVVSSNDKINICPLRNIGMPKEENEDDPLCHYSEITNLC